MLIRAPRSRKGHKLWLSIAASLIVLSLWIISQSADDKNMIQGRNKKQTELLTNKTKHILLASSQFGDRNWFLGSKDEYWFHPLRNSTATGHTCCVTSRMDSVGHFSDFDALFFHNGDIWPWLSFYYRRLMNERQRVVFFTHESPLTYPLSGFWNLFFRNFFTTTLTYRDDSDLVVKYFDFRKRGRPEVISAETRSAWVSRPNKVFWIVSNCHAHSMRERYAFELKKYIQVDIYGKCADRDFDVGQLSREYKFYLSFENSLCEGYVTEKLSRPLQDSVLPIVMGGANYSHEAPPGSVIDVLDFPSAKDLAQYLLRLDQDSEEYLKYFAWREHYEIVEHKSIFAALCDRLWYPNQETKGAIPDLRKWWTEHSSRNASVPIKPACTDAKTMFWSKYAPPSW